MVNTLGKIVGILLVLVGIIWILQGVNLLPGSFMTGNPQWTINGAISAGIGLALFWFFSRKKA